MRLIDADALIAECETISSAEWNKRAAPISWSHAYDTFIDEIDSTPTIDAVPVVHGRWELGDDGKMHCCSCDKVPTNKILVGGHAILHIADVKQIMKYCPNCGAKMDLEVDGDA